MELETFFEKFELLADAPNGVQKLRELILQLAVQGKLVPQDPNDEPASVLLKRIEAEKAKLIKEGKIDKSKKLPQIKADKIPFELPDGWEWVYLEQISNAVHYGYTASANHELKDVRLLRITDIQDNKVHWETVPGCQIEKSKLKNYKLNNDDLLIARTGGTIGKSYLVEDLLLCAVFASYLIRIIPAVPFAPKYLKLFLESEFYWNQLHAKSMGTGQPNVNATSLKALIVPIPALTEQKRIVAKVDRLMALCDELEARQEKQHKRILKLGEVATSQLLTPSTPEAFNQHWQGICDNFDLLYSTPKNVSQLRQAILQLAVLGKLVPQDPNDEPASVLLERIKEEKTRLIKEGKIRNDKPLPAVNVDEVPFDLPLGWEVVRFEELADIVSGVTKGRKLADRKTTSYPYLRVANVQRGYLDLKIIKEIEAFVDELEKYRLQAGDILMTEGGDWDKLGRTAIWNDEVEDCIHQNHVFRARPLNKGLHSHWIALYTNSRMGRIYFEEASKKTTNLASINMTQLRNCPIPVPPVFEQERIINKVNYYSLLCDELEDKLKQSINDKEKLMETAVRQVLEV